MRVEGGVAPPIEFTDKIDVSDLALAERSEPLKYMRDIAEGERASINESVAGLVNADQLAEEEAKRWASHFREQRKGIKADLKRFASALRTGKLEVEEEVFFFPDRLNGKVHVYDHLGNRIMTRRMNADEAQLKIQ